MRAAGYDVRVLPEEARLGGKPADAARIHPPRSALVPGQHAVLALSMLPGLKPVSRYQLALRDPDVSRLAGLDRPAGARHARGRVARRPAIFIRADAGIALFVCVLVMWFAPKIATAIDVLLRPDAAPRVRRRRALRRRLSSSRRLLLLLSPIMWFGHTMFLTGLLFGREIGWIGQTRDDHAVPLALALRNLWPHTLLGCGALGVAGRDACRQRSPMRCSSPPGRRWRFRLP